MSTSPSERLRQLRRDRGFATAAEAARAFGWSDVTYTSHENGTRGIRKDAAQRYAKAFGVSAGYILGLQAASDKLTITEGLPILREAALGVWRDKMYSGSPTEGRISVPRGSTVPDDYGVRITDSSVDKKFPVGSVAICRPLHSSEVETLSDGDFVVVKRDRNGLSETTVRRVHVSGDKLRLTTYSTDARLTDSIVTPRSEPHSVAIVARITGLFISL